MEKSVVIATTGLYTSEEGDLCLQSNPVRKRKGRPRKLANFAEDDDSIRIPKALMCSAKENSFYKQLVQSMDFLQTDKNELAQQFIDAYSQSSSTYPTAVVPIKYIRHIDHDCLWCKEIDWRTKAEVILLLKYRRWSYGSVSSKLKVPMHNIKWILKCFHKLSEFQKQTNKINTPKLRRILSDAQIEWLSDYLSNNKGKQIFAKQVKLITEQQFPEVGEISLSTVTRLLKRKLCLSYKKLSKRNIASVRRSNIIKFVEVCSII